MVKLFSTVLLLAAVALSAQQGPMSGTIELPSPPYGSVEVHPFHIQPNPIAEYTVVHGWTGTLEAFVTDVNKLVKQGWMPVGAPFIMPGSREIYQALVRYKP